MKRRDFLQTAALGTATTLFGRTVDAAPPSDAAELARKLPEWHGFNLLEKFIKSRHNGPFLETDFQWIAEWGFDFVRLPMDYRCWTDSADPYKLDENVLGEIDQAVELGKKYGVHVNLNLHRAPGYTVASPPETLDLWTDEEAQKQFDFQWSQFARRYRGIPTTRLSFDLVNEPANVSNEAYAKVVRRVVGAIRRVDPNRLIVADGVRYGRDPMFELADLGVGQSTRGYDPFPLTHYQASWAGGHRFALPTWPLKQGDQLLDRDWIYKDRIVPWKKLEAQGVGVHVGEWGVYNKTPHDVTLAWMRDCLQLWKEAGWGWALWNFRGSFGILDSGRADVAYEAYHGHKLDRKMLQLLQEFS
ncbi:MAG: cellulase family glycosylhydrolase [Thermoguttaceae bacterium]